MKIRCILRHAVACVVVSLMALSAAAQNYPTPKEGDCVTRPVTRIHTVDEIHLEDAFFAHS